MSQLDKAIEYTNQGLEFANKGKVDQAIEAYKKAHEQAPWVPIPPFNIGVLYENRGDIVMAIKYFKKAIQANDKFDKAYTRLGIIYGKKGDFSKASHWLEKSIVANPKDDYSHFVLASVYAKLGKTNSVLESLKNTVAINPKNVYAYNNLGVIYTDRKELDLAIDNLNKALKLDPNIAITHGNLGAAYLNKGEYVKATKALEKAIDLDSNYARAHFHLGLIKRKKEPDVAEEMFTKALEINPKFYDSLNVLVFTLMHKCEWEKIDYYSDQLTKLTKKQLDGKGIVNETPFINVVRCDDKKLNKDIAINRSEDIERVVSQYKTDYDHQRSKTKKIIKIGYLSSDFYNHATAHLMLGLFKAHDRRKFIINVYSYGPKDKSIYRRSIEKHADSFFDISDFSDKAAADKIYKDKVDILVDLKGHTGDNRLEICAQKPTPIQLHYIGFPGTTGASFFDYLITDRIITPKGHEKYYTEKLIFLPNSYQINDDKQKISTKKVTRSQLGLPEKSFIFSNFNRSYKFDKKTFAIWMNILKQTKKSVLWMLKSNSTAEKNIKNKAEELGVNSKRIIYADKLPKDKHLARISLSDLALDTILCNGHTTTTDVLWAGVPVITCLGKHFASRVSASLLTAIDLKELITSTPLKYEQLAISLAKNPDRLGDIKKQLSKNRNKSSLFDTKGKVNDLESAYDIIWNNYLMKKDPKSINIKSK